MTRKVWKNNCHTFYFVPLFVSVKIEPFPASFNLVKLSLCLQCFHLMIKHIKDSESPLVQSYGTFFSKDQLEQTLQEHWRKDNIIMW